MRIGVLSIRNGNYFFRGGTGIVELLRHKIRDKIILGAMKNQGRSMGGTYSVDRGILGGREMAAMTAEPFSDVQDREDRQMIGVL